MSVTWSKDQQKIINSRNQTLLVAAAAGSGKTAVLVERILSRISDEENPVDIDHFLVVTFTNAAAAQMRERLDDAIEERLAMLDEGAKLYKRLKRQQMLLDNAQISTIHQFCLSIIRNHFNKLDIDPAFRVADEGELKLIKSDVAEELLEGCYLEGTEEFYDLTESICTGKNDDALTEVILKLYEASVSHPEPDKWLDGIKQFYNISSEEEFEALPDVKYLMEYKDNVMDGILKAWNAGLRAVLSENGPAAYEKVFNADKAVIDAIMGADSYGRLVEAWASCADGFITMPRIKAGSADASLQEEAKAKRDKVKTELKKLMDSYFVIPPEEVVGQVQRLKGRAFYLIELTAQFAVRFKEKKREKNLVDFNDLEHFALEILLDEKNGVMLPGAVADEYSEYFCEIMVDEYQDSNMVQEAIINAVSGERFGKDNVFMVGDVKQSIYKFRMARPDLFLAKYHAFSKEDNAKKQCIELSSNYRSRKQVLDAANSIFENIMNKSFGGIEYDDRSSLKCGMKFAEVPDENVYRAEILLADRTIDDEKEDGAELEAKLMAERIRKLVSGNDGFKVWDKSRGEYRKCEYGDIVILLRGLTGRADTYVKILGEEGIPAFSQSGAGYFDAYEVQVMINCLRILNNPLNDIALTAVLHSPIGGFSSEELSLIRIANRTESIYEGLVKYDGSNEKLKLKLSDFLTKYNKLRAMVPYMPLHKLIRTVLKETGYDDFCMAMPAGEKRRMNLYMLVQKAVEFEGTSYKGLFNFVRYLDKLKKYEIDYGEASAVGAAGNTVRIMTIHKSKGLEFPVVFIGGIGKRFNQQDAAEKIVIHADYGIGFDVIDAKRRTSEAAFKRKVLQGIIKKENLEEELRVLYVAMTRAVEKLILVGSFEKLEEKLNKNWKTAEADFLTLISAGSYADWIMPFCGREFAVNICNAAEVLGIEEKRQMTEMVKEQFLHLMDKDMRTVDAAFKKLIEERFEYKYSQAESIGVSAAISVSELKRLSYVAEDEPESFIKPEKESIVPKFIQNSDDNGCAGQENRGIGMQVGTAYHTVFWKLDFSDTLPDRTKIQMLIDELKSQGSITAEAAERISIRRLLAFEDSELYRRMSRAHMRGLLKREQPFVMGMDAAKVRQDWPEGEMILVQGVIDAFFEEDGELVVVDYKTDIVNEADGENVLIRRYKRQMELYAKALEQITGKRVKSKIIYSTGLAREVKVEE